MSGDQRVLALKKAFEANFGREPEYIVRAPGRVNLLGEHTDYNDGYVFPMAIEHDFLIAASPKANRKDLESKVFSMDLDDGVTFSLTKLEKDPAHAWADYMKGMLSIWQACAFKVRAFEGVMTGNVPQGAGLSSSAAYEVAVGTLVNEMMATGISPKQIAMLAQKAENKFVGVQCGIMDQFISDTGRPDAASLIDCRTLASRPVPLRLAERGLAVAIVHTGVKRGLVDSQYNQRREECQEAVAVLSKKLKRDDVKALRDVSAAELKTHAKALSETVLKRARHVVTENERVLDGVEALGRGDVKAFGKLMAASHASLRDDYEVSCPELDTLVELASKHPGVLGARMTGAGFGGCIVALLPADGVAAFEREVLPAYQMATGLEPKLWVSQAAAGASVIDSPMKRAGL